MIDIDYRKLRGLVFAFVVAVLICAAIEALSGCTRTVYVPVESVKHDSIRLTDVRVDSVMLHDSVYIKERGDTTFYYKWRTEYKYKLRTDTCYVSKVDSIQVPYKVEVVKKEIPKVMWQCVFVMGMAILGLITYIRLKE